MIRLSSSCAMLGAVSILALTAAGCSPKTTEAIPATPVAAAAPTADADMQAVLDQLAALGGKPIETLEPADARLQPTPADAVKALMVKQGMSTAPDPTVTTKDMTYPAGAGMQKARVYMPTGAKRPLPVVLYIHGGGWVIADIDVYDASPRALAKMANAIVVSIEYRHAPAAKFPAASDSSVLMCCSSPTESLPIKAAILSASVCAAKLKGTSRWPLGCKTRDLGSRMRSSPLSRR